MLALVLCRAESHGRPVRAAGGGTVALDARIAARGRLADGDGGSLAQVSQRVGQADGGGLAVALARGGHGDDEDELAFGLALTAAQLIDGNSGDKAAEREDSGRVRAELRGDGVATARGQIMNRASGGCQRMVAGKGE